MSHNNYNCHHARRVKLYAALFLMSFALNVGLLSAIYFRPVATLWKRDTALEKKFAGESIAGLLIADSARDFDQLVTFLDDTSSVEEGYLRRDVALAALVNFHDFDIDRALGSQSLQKRNVLLKSEGSAVTQEVTLIPGLSDMQYGAVKNFIRVEKWPITRIGIFTRVKEAEKSVDLDLLSLFVSLPIYKKMSALFHRAHLEISQPNLIALLRSGSYDLAERHTKYLGGSTEECVEQKEALLLDYMEEGSRIATKLLLSGDISRLEKVLSDDQMLQLLKLASDKAIATKSIASNLLSGCRCDKVRRAAALKLYQIAGEKAPASYDHARALMRFAPESLALEEERSYALNMNLTQEESAEEPHHQIHVVQSGDSLWKISRKYNVSIQSLKEENQLPSETLTVGQNILIP